MIEPICAKLYKWKQSGINIKYYVRLDNAIENKKFIERCESKDWKLILQFEFIARDTPHQIDLAELGFTVLTSRGRAIMSSANIPMLLEGTRGV